MNVRLCACIGVAALASLLVALRPLDGQERKPGWSVPRTPAGQPDFQGYWTNATYTPVERPAELGTKEFYTEAEVLAYEKQRRLKEDNQPATDVHYDDKLWQSESYLKGVSNRRTSMIFDPPDGRVPALTAQGERRAAELKQAARLREGAESAQVRNLAERCISWGAEGPPMLGSTYNANLQIVQTESSVVIYNEMMHGVRIVPLDGRAHLPAGIRQMGGDSRGRWDGETLVVETTNFTDDTNFRGPPATTRQDIFSSRDLKVTERFTRVGPEEIVYRFTLEDPSTWVRPWSGELVMRRFEGPIYEYACHEGNYGLANILAGARASEKAAAAGSR
jgi:hypothetical protein